ncbi:MAG: hypothetical protein AAGC81_01745 [Pseudomonadota bacterium]
MAPPIDNTVAAGVLAGVTMIAAGTSSEVSAASITQGPFEYSIFVSSQGEPGSDTDTAIVNFEGFSGADPLTSVLLDHDRSFSATNDGNADLVFTLTSNNEGQFADLNVGNGENDPFQVDLLAAIAGFDFSEDFFIQVEATLQNGESVFTSGGSGISVTFVTAEVPLPGAAIGLLTGVAGLAGVSLLRRRRD